MNSALPNNILEFNRKGKIYIRSWCTFSWYTMSLIATLLQLSAESFCFPRQSMEPVSKGSLMYIPNLPDCNHVTYEDAKLEIQSLNFIIVVLAVTLIDREGRA